MNAGTAINTLLKADVGVDSLVGDRIYPAIIPAKVVYPAVVYSELSQVYEYSKDGREDSGNHSFDVDTYAKTYKSAHEIATAVFEALDWYTGTINTVAINRIWKAEQSDVIYEDEKELFHISQTFNIKLD